MRELTMMFLWVIVTTLAIARDEAEVKLNPEAPVAITRIDAQTVLVDFGKVAFGNLKLRTPAGSHGGLTFHFGEAFKNGRIDRKPPGTVRYAMAKVPVGGASSVVVAPPADGRNTKQPEAVLTPSEWGVVLPFRWVEIEGWPGEPAKDDIVRQSAWLASWDDNAALFQCSDEMLNRIWELCRYSIKATSFAGVYVDGDRERIPYEADAYLNQLSHYATGNDISMARATFDRLMDHPTWPSEWGPHMVFIAHADWMHTGDAKWLSPRYDNLKRKMLSERVGADGLVTSNAKQIGHDDIVDWPVGERDGFVFTATNSVVNAFHLAALGQMKNLAEAVGNRRDATDFGERYARELAIYQKSMFDPARSVFRDGVGTDHASQHASLFPLAFGLVPEASRPAVAKWLARRGMACSVYGAQYLLEGLFENDQADAALRLMTAPGDRSWRHMVESDTTITWEAWDQRFKPNQDWNHAWGAAPANLLPRFIIGARPLAPGWKRALIRPHVAGLTSAKGKVPTPLGPIMVDWKTSPSFMISIRLPQGMPAKVELPATPDSKGVQSAGKAVAAHREGAWWILDSDLTKDAVLEVK